jgi:hypothetical protein
VSRLLQLKVLLYGFKVAEEFKVTLYETSPVVEFIVFVIFIGGGGIVEFYDCD